MSSIIVNKNYYSFDAIKHDGATLLSGQDAGYIFSFKLAQQWLSNQQEFVFHTSGSTGIPKKINLHRDQLEASAKGTIETLSLTAHEHILICMNTQFIGGAMLLIRGLILNATITLQEPSSNPLQFIETKHPYTFVSFAPLQLISLLQHKHNETEKLNRFNTILIGGAAINKKLEAALNKLNTKVFHTYGMTETVSHIALKQIGKDDYFTLLKGVNIRTDDRHCLAIKSVSTQNNWIQTNDVVELIDETSFTILGRADDVINSGGIKIFPAKIEAVIRSFLSTTISHVIVCGIDDLVYGQKVIALIETKNWDNTQQKRLELELAKKLPKQEMPKLYYALPAFYYTPTGKINKAETLKMIDLSK